MFFSLFPWHWLAQGSDMDGRGILVPATVVRSQQGTCCKCNSWGEVDGFRLKYRNARG